MCASNTHRRCTSGGLGDILAHQDMCLVWASLRTSIESRQGPLHRESKGGTPSSRPKDTVASSTMEIVSRPVGSRNVMGLLPDVRGRNEPRWLHIRQARPGSPKRLDGPWQPGS